MTIVARLIAPLIAAAAAGSIALAPSAGATSNPTGCREAGAAKVCQKQGHASLHAKPTPRNTGGPLSSAWLPGYGRGPALPPMIALFG